MAAIHREDGSTASLEDHTTVELETAVENVLKQKGYDVRVFDAEITEDGDPLLQVFVVISIADLSALFHK